MNQVASTQNIDLTGKNVFRKSRSSIFLRRFIMVLFILIPTASAYYYAYYVASPMYLSEVRFLIRGGSSTAKGVGKVLKSLGSSGPMDALTDGFAVRDYLSSMDAMLLLDKRTGFYKRMLGKGDVLNHVKKNPSREELYDFYSSVIDVRYNLTEGIVILKFYAFTPKDAYEVAQELTKIAEEFSNNLNNRAREDSLRLALLELKNAQEILTKAQLKINQWRTEHGNIDPVAQSKMLNKIIAQLESQLVKYRTELVELDTVGTNTSYRIGVLKKRIEAIEKQLAKEKLRLTGGQRQDSVVSQLREYEQLALSREFAVKNFENAQISLQRARLVILHKQKYVVTVVKPSLPEDPVYPKPVTLVLAVFFTSLITYGMGSLVFAAIRDSHAT